ncbi:MAG: oxidoreductase, partial [Micromonosporaceae bacterium]|nr:oxidoreductase [Micromonosporaceae bacterium]
MSAGLIKQGFARGYWIALHVFVGLCLFWGRVVEPVWVNARHRFRVVNVVREADDWVSIYVTGRRLGTLDVQAGQYFRWRFLHPGCWWQAHPFSLSAPPNPDWLQDLTPGTRVLLSGPHGAFTPDRRTR